MQNFILYAVTAFIWGSTWIAIKYQLGTVDPLLSIAYRFLLSAVIILSYCAFTKRQLKFSFINHLYFVLQGIFLFSIHYWMVYMAEQTLTSGLVAVIFSSIVFLNIFYSHLIIKTPVENKVIWGALIGTIGIVLVFQNEITEFDLTNQNSIALIFCIVAANMASIGNIISAIIQKRQIPVLQINGYSMLYGSAIVSLIALILNKPFIFDTGFSYIISLLYLALFGSVIAFTTYLTLLGRIGAGKAGYVTLLFPVIALILSTFFESYQWTLYAILGIAFILAGNFLVLSKKTSA